MSMNSLPDTLQHTLDYLCNVKDLKSWSSYEENGFITLTLKWRPKHDHDDIDSSSTPYASFVGYKKKSARQAFRDQTRRDSWLQQRKANVPPFSSDPPEQSSEIAEEHCSEVEHGERHVYESHANTCSVVGSNTVTGSPESVETDHCSPVKSTSQENTSHVNIEKPATPPRTLPSKPVCVETKPKDSKTPKWKYTDVSGKKWTPVCVNCQTVIPMDITSPFRHCDECLRSGKKVDICSNCWAYGFQHNVHRRFISSGSLLNYDPYDAVDNG